MNKKIFVLIGLVFLMTGVLSAQNNMQPQSEINILGVNAVGNKTISDNSVKVQSGLIEGKTIKRTQISEGIKKLWKLEVFEDIQVKVERETSDGVFLRIVVEEATRMTSIEYKGNENIKDNKLNEEIGLVRGSIVTSYMIADAKRKIKDFYKEKGFLNAKIENKIIDLESQNGKKLVFQIEENKKVRIKDIKFVGNENASSWALHRVFEDTDERFIFLFSWGKFNRKEYQEDKQNLYSFYRKKGYRDFEIVRDSISYTDNKKRMNITVFIDEGPRYKYRNINFTGNIDVPDQVLLNNLGIESGDWYNKEKFQKNLNQNVSSIYMDRGYLFAQVQPTEVPVGQNKVDVNINIRKQNKVYVGLININGNYDTRESVIRRQLKLFPGELFNRSQLKRSVRELQMLDYFSDIKPNVNPVEESKVNLGISVEEKSSNKANLSASYSQAHGIIGGGGFTFNNFRGRGQELEVSYNQGTKYRIGRGGDAPEYRSMSLSFTEPWLFNTPNLIGASFQYTKRGGGRAGYSYNYYPFDMDVIGGSVKYGRRFRWPDNYFEGIWRIGYYNKNYDNVRGNLGLNDRTSTSITQIISRDSRDMPQFPTTGSQFQLNTVLSKGISEGSVDYVKNKMALTFFNPLFWKFVIKNQMKFGVVNTIGDKGIVPPDERFIMGGAGMIYGEALRGYKDNNVGPTSSYGGKTMFKYSMEFRLSISKQPTVYALTFAEAGNVWKSLSETDPFDLKRSVGAGVRFILPQVGMIGVDIGYGFDSMDPEGLGVKQGWETHFIFGRNF